MINPYEHDDPLGLDREDDDRFLCGCGDTTCWLLGNDVDNVLVNGRWFASACCALCWNCGRVDEVSKLFPIGSGRWVHDGCPTPAMEEGRIEALKRDEIRDDVNGVRR